MQQAILTMLVSRVAIKAPQTDSQQDDAPVQGLEFRSRGHGQDMSSILRQAVVKWERIFRGIDGFGAGVNCLIVSI